MKPKHLEQWLLLVTLVASLATAMPIAPSSAAGPGAGPSTLWQSPLVSGPFISPPVEPYVWNGDLRDLPQLPAEAHPPLRDLPRPGTTAKTAEAPDSWVDPLAQTASGPGQMPAPLSGFEGLNINDGGGWHPPDTNGDVGPTYYLQVVNIGLGIFDKATGQALVKVSYNDFFQGPPGSPCDNQNRGDVIALYDVMADRWIVSDFSLPTNESHQCIAVSQSGDPIGGGWYFYDLDTESPEGSWCDYPKLGVWPDAYYLSCNMFDPWIGANVWALDRAAMLGGAPMTAIRFGTGAAYASLLPSNMKGAQPPAGSPGYYLSVDMPGTLHLWRFFADWANPNNSHFDGPIDLPVAAWSMIDDIPQQGTGQTLDSLGDRLMFSLHYRNMGTYESLWVNHTVQSNGVAGVRWYEVRDPGGSPYVYQQGTFQPDGNYRWMGSTATDREGNMALGYSISSAQMYPSIRYAGRLNGEVPGLLPQGEAVMLNGTGSQTGSGRWGDYSLMTVDPVDDCTFWYTQEWVQVTGGNWNTWIGSFRFPSCGQAKGWISGTVYNATTGSGIPGAPLLAEGPAMTMLVETDASGTYLLPLLGGTYTLTAGPLLPSFPLPNTVAGVVVTTGTTITVDIPLSPVPHLVGGAVAIDDDVPGGNNNGYPEPGETGLLLYAAISNTGATTATHVSGQLLALTAGVTVSVAQADYPDIGIGEALPNTAPFVFSIDPALPCGTRLDFQEVVTADQGIYTITFSLAAKVPLPIVHAFSDDMESGPGGWTHGGTPNLWAITEETAHSPSHSWSDSPGADYSNNANTWLRTPILNLGGMAGLTLDFWHLYNLESGWDYGYVEYSLNGGGSWSPFAVSYTGLHSEWQHETIDAAVLDNQTNVALRFRLTSDGSVYFDGWHIDDVDLSYQPFACYYLPPAVPTPLSPPDGTFTASPLVTFTWQPEAGGGDAEGYNLDVDGTVYTTSATFQALSLPLGSHTWQVQAFNSGGVSGYSVPWTVTVVETPSVPILLAPPDGALFTTTHAVTFTWQAGSGSPPAGYDLELDGSLIHTTEPSYLATLDAGPHGWRVRACNVAGCSDYSVVWTLQILDAPAVPILLAPPDGALTTTHALTFTWQAGAGSPPERYNLELDGVVFTTTEAFHTVTLDAGDHTWRVQACNAAGCSGYSPAWTVRVADLPGVPVLLAPADGTLAATPAITFTWQAGSGGEPEGYHIELDGQVFTTTLPLYATVLGPGTHTWRVRAFNLAGYSDFSDPWTVILAYRVYLPVVSKH